MSKLHTVTSQSWFLFCSINARMHKLIDEALLGLVCYQQWRKSHNHPSHLDPDHNIANQKNMTSLEVMKMTLCTYAGLGVQT